jgi:hypothetical protein
VSHELISSLFWEPVSVVALGGGYSLAILAAGTPAFADIARPGDIIAGYTQLRVAQAWWQWAVGVPAPNNPLLDTTGANAGVNNNGPFFLWRVLAGAARW